MMKTEVISYMSFKEFFTVNVFLTERRDSSHPKTD
ncbi:hypothetical protein CHRY9393_03384 [Chryseobacterium fistulae]|uniref:Uncharacterized protein n=1 Tax=Chryseobacterium fistulae TaxID=2675058 RepID=A0A6N4XWC0_9FLAO|nr:hypothetical protein CHRY9393_03384 [Chryseobacterium fistulae]